FPSSVVRRTENNGMAASLGKSLPGKRTFAIGLTSGRLPTPMAPSKFKSEGGKCMSPLRIVSLLIVILGTVEISPDCAARINFLTGRNYPSGEYPSAAAVHDFNNDGVSDIASANINEGNIS